MARIGFRSTTSTDEGAIRALLQHAHGIAQDHPMFAARHLYWKYWEPRAGWQGSRSYVLTRDAEIIAHAAIVPAVCTWGTGRLGLLHVIDWAAQPQARGAGNTLMRHIGTLADAIATSDGGEEALRLLPFMGFRQSNTVVTLYARPLRPLLYLSGAQVPLWRRGARCVRNSFWALQARSVEPGTRRARQVRPSELAGMSLPWPVPRGGAAVLERSVDLMRYWLDCPAAPLELYRLENAGVAEGYFVLAFAPGQARLADCWVDSEQPAAWRALVQLAVQQAARREGIAELAAISSEPLLAGALEHCGFHPRALRPLYVRATADARLPPAAIRIQMLDDDAAYRHDGTRVLWA